MHTVDRLRFIVTALSLFFSCIGSFAGPIAEYPLPFFTQFRKDVVVYRDLSNRYVYSIESVSDVDEDGERGNITSIKISIIKKPEGRLIQEITVPFDGVSGKEQFLNPNRSRSSVTGARMKEPVEDYDHGDFVVHDFNFDGKEDFALKIDMGGNRGPLYRFYVAGEGNIVREDDFLNEAFASMPEVDKQRKVLKVYIYMGASGIESTVSYRYDPVKKRWSKVSR